MPRDEKDGTKWRSNKKAKKKGLDWKHRSAKHDIATRQEREELREERRAKGLCLKCGQEGHFAKECPSSKLSDSGGAKGAKPRPQVSLTSLLMLDPREAQGNDLASSDKEYLETPEAALLNESTNKLIFVNVVVNDVCLAALVDTGPQKTL